MEKAFEILASNFKSFPRVNAFLSFLLILAMFNTVISLIWLKDRLHGYCLDGKYHKKSPSPESSLHDQCSPWKSQSCCTHKTTERIHDLTLYKLNYSQCSPLSESCKKHFIRDLCFYECSPDIGPWVEEVEGKKTRKERLRNVPLCRSECDKWFDACRGDFICSRNWIKDGTHCPNSSVCATIEDTYHSAENFCEEIFDYSWKYTPDDEPCAKMWFEPAQPNSTDIARLEASGLLRSDVIRHIRYFVILIMCFCMLYMIYLTMRSTSSPVDWFRQRIPFMKMGRVVTTC